MGLTTWIGIAACTVGVGFGAAGCSASDTKGSLPDAAPTTASDEDGPDLAYYSAGLAGDAALELDAPDNAPPPDGAPSDGGAEQ